MPDNEEVKKEIAPKNKGGRPLEWTDDKIEKECDALEEWIKDDSNYFLGSFAVHRGYYTELLDKFASRHERFRMTLKKARSFCEERLVNLAVTKKRDGAFIKFVLQNKAGWRDQKEVTGAGGNPLSIILERIGAIDPVQTIELNPEEIEYEP